MTTSEYNLCVDQLSDRVYRFVLKNIKDEEKAKDIVQESFLKLWTKVSEVDSAKAKSYLFTTAHHTMIDFIRREKKQGDMEEARLESTSYEGTYSDLNEILHRALELLPEMQKSVVLLRDYEGYSYQEISEITSLSESQVKVYIFRARKFLKAHIGKIEAVL